MTDTQGTQQPQAAIIYSTNIYDAYDKYASVVSKPVSMEQFVKTVQADDGSGSGSIKGVYDGFVSKGYDGTIDEFTSFITGKSHDLTGWFDKPAIKTASASAEFGKPRAYDNNPLIGSDYVAPAGMEVKHRDNLTKAYEAYSGMTANPVGKKQFADIVKANGDDEYGSIRAIHNNFVKHGYEGSYDDLRSYLYGDTEDTTGFFGSTDPSKMKVKSPQTENDVVGNMVDAYTRSPQMRADMDDIAKYIERMQRSQYKSIESSVDVQSKLEELKDNVKSGRMTADKANEEYASFVNGIYESKYAGGNQAVADALFSEKVKAYMQSGPMSRYYADQMNGQVGANELAMAVRDKEKDIDSRIPNLEQKIHEGREAFSRDHIIGGQTAKNRQNYDFALRIENETKDILNRPKDSDSGWDAFWEGAGDSVSSADNWLMGILSLSEAGIIMDAVRHYEEGKGLNESEEALLDAVCDRYQATAMRQNNTNGWYNAGRIGGDSLPFVASFILTGGLAGALEGAGNAAKAGLVKLMSNQFIKKAEKDFAKKGVKNASQSMIRARAAAYASGEIVNGRNIAARVTERVVNQVVHDAVRVPVAMAISPAFWTGMAENATADIESKGTDKDGNRTYSMTYINKLPVAKKIQEQFIEFWSEGVGYGLGKAFHAVTSVISAGAKASSVAGKIARAFNAVSLKGGAVSRYSGINGPIPELLEEDAGAAARLVSGIDSKEEYDRFWEPENQLQLLVGMVPMSLLGGAVNTAKAINAKRAEGVIRNMYESRTKDRKLADELIYALKNGSQQQVCDLMRAEGSGMQLSKEEMRKLSEAAFTVRKEAIDQMTMDDVKYLSADTYDDDAAHGLMAGIRQLANSDGRIYMATVTENGAKKDNVVLKGDIVLDKDNNLDTAKSGNIFYEDTTTHEVKPVSKMNVTVNNVSNIEDEIQTAIKELNSTREQVKEGGKITEQEALERKKADFYASIEDRKKKDGSYDQDRMTAEEILTYSEYEVGKPKTVEIIKAEIERLKAQIEADKTNTEGGAIGAVERIKREDANNAKIKSYEEYVAGAEAEKAETEAEQAEVLAEAEQQTEQPVQQEQEEKPKTKTVERIVTKTIDKEMKPSEVNYTDKSIVSAKVTLKDGTKGIVIEFADGKFTVMTNQGRRLRMTAEQLKKRARSFLVGDKVQEVVTEEVPVDSAEAQETAQEQEPLQEQEPVQEQQEAPADGQRTAEEGGEETIDENSDVSIVPEEHEKPDEQETEQPKQEEKKEDNEKDKKNAEIARDIVGKLGLDDGTITIIDNISQLPEEEKDKADTLKKGNVKGWYNVKTGKAYIYSPAITSQSDAVETIFHEALAHRGLRRTLGEDRYNKLCDLVWADMSLENKRRFLAYANGFDDASIYSSAKVMTDKYGKEYIGMTGLKLFTMHSTNDEMRRKAADEYMASVMEHAETANRKFLAKVKNAIKKFLLEHGFKVEITDDFIKSLGVRMLDGNMTETETTTATEQAETKQENVDDNADADAFKNTEEAEAFYKDAVKEDGTISNADANTLLSSKFTPDEVKDDIMDMYDDGMVEFEEIKPTMTKEQAEKVLANTDNGKSKTNKKSNDTRFRISSNNKQTIDSWLGKREDLTAEQKGAFVSYIQDFEPKMQLATAKWFANQSIRIPEDMPKVEQALQVADRTKDDPLRYGNPMELINAHPGVEIKEKPINPETVPTLHKIKELPHGVVIYQVDDSQESRENMRRIINTHFGKDSSPWCLLQGDGNGNLTERSAHYWYDTYNAYPKMVSFVNGKLSSFSANASNNIIWWNKQDKSSKYVGDIKVPETYKGYNGSRIQHVTQEGDVVNGGFEAGKKGSGFYISYDEDGYLDIKEEQKGSVLIFEDPNDIYYDNSFNDERIGVIINKLGRMSKHYYALDTDIFNIIVGSHNNILQMSLTPQDDNVFKAINYSDNKIGDYKELTIIKHNNTSYGMRFIYHTIDDTYPLDNDDIKYTIKDKSGNTWIFDEIQTAYRRFPRWLIKTDTNDELFEYAIKSKEVFDEAIKYNDLSSLKNEIINNINNIRSKYIKEGYGYMIDDFKELTGFDVRTMSFENEKKQTDDNVRFRYTEVKDDFEKSIKQSFGSAATSLNQTAAAFKKIDWKEGTTNLDLGGGAYDQATEYLSERGVKNMVFDPFNRSAEHNEEVATTVRDEGVDTVTCNNVLNVIDSEESRDNVILQAAKALKEGGVAYFSVYDGDKSGVGKQTKKDSWQNNRTTKSYMDEVARYFDDVTIKDNVIIAKNPKQTYEVSVWDFDGKYKGNDIRYRITSSDAFKKWFDGSKVVDENGNPLVVYHGASMEQMYFKDGLMYTRRLPHWNVFEDTKGWFTNSKTAANEFSKLTNGDVYECYLSIKKPYIVDCKGQDWNDIKDDVLSDLPYKHTSITGKISVNNIAWDIYNNHSDEYDGVIFKNVLDGSNHKGDLGGLVDEYVHFNSNQVKSAEEFTYDDKGNVIPVDARFDETTDDIRYRFIGIKGATNLQARDAANDMLSNLDIARKMEAELKPTWKTKDKESEDYKKALRIKQATGWERGADGKWRYEMTDFDEVFDFLDEIKSEHFGKAHLGSTYDSMSKSGLYSLIQAYPQLYDTNVEFYTDKNTDTRGAYIDSSNTIKLNRAYEDTMTGTLIHEIQHAIQSIEGFSQGTSTDSDAARSYGWETHKNLYDNDKEYKKWYDDTRKAYDDFSYVMSALHIINPDVLNYNVDEFKKFVDDNKETLSNNLWFDYNPYIRDVLLTFKENKFDKLQDVINDINSAYSDMLNTDMSYEYYHKKGGEVESRNADVRRRYNNEQRRNSLAIDTEDVARDEQIFLESELGEEEVEPVRYDAELSEERKSEVKQVFDSRPSSDILFRNDSRFTQGTPLAEGYNEVDGKDVAKKIDWYRGKFQEFLQRRIYDKANRWIFNNIDDGHLLFVLEDRMRKAGIKIDGGESLYKNWERVSSEFTREANMFNDGLATDLQKIMGAIAGLHISDSRSVINGNTKNKPEMDHFLMGMYLMALDAIEVKGLHDEAVKNNKEYAEALKKAQEEYVKNNTYDIKVFNVSDYVPASMRVLRVNYKKDKLGKDTDEVSSYSVVINSQLDVTVDGIEAPSKTLKGNTTIISGTLKPDKIQDLLGNQTTFKGLVPMEDVDAEGNVVEFKKRGVRPMLRALGIPYRAEDFKEMYEEDTTDDYDFFADAELVNKYNDMLKRQDGMSEEELETIEYTLLQEWVDRYESEVSSRSGDANLTNSLSNKVREIARYYQDLLHDSGVMSDSYYEAMRSRKFYVPQRGYEITEDMDLMVDNYIHYSYGNNGQVLADKQSTDGDVSHHLAFDPVANLLNIAYNSIRQSKLNSFRRETLLPFIRKYKDQKDVRAAMRIYEYDEKDEEGNVIGKAEYTLNNDKSLTEKEKSVISGTERFVKNTKDKGADAQQNYVFVRDGDKVYVVKMSDESMANAINGKHDNSKYSSVGVTYATRYLAQAHTRFNPLFAKANYMRDVATALTYGGIDYGAGFQWDFLKANIDNNRLLKDIIIGKKSGLSDEFEEALSLGIATGFHTWKKCEDIRKDFMKYEKFYTKGKFNKEKFLHYLNNIANIGSEDQYLNKFFGLLTEYTEMKVRFASYRAALAMGKSKKEAAFIAKDNTVNLSQQGYKKSSIGTWQIFALATLKGTLKFCKEFREHPVKMTAVSLVYLGLGMLTSIYFGDDDDKMSDYERSNNHFIPLGGGKYYKYPVTHDYGISCYGIGVKIADYAMGRCNGWDLALGIASSIINEFLPEYLNPIKTIQQSGVNLMPTVFRMASDLYANKTYNGMTIYNADMTGIKSITPKYALQDNVSVISKWLSELVYLGSGGERLSMNYLPVNGKSMAGLDVDPKLFDWIGSNFAPHMKWISQIATIIYKDIVAYPVTVEDIPFVGRSLMDIDAAWREKRQLNAHYFMIKGMIDRSEAANKYIMGDVKQGGMDVDVAVGEMAAKMTAVYNSKLKAAKEIVSQYEKTVKLSSYNDEAKLERHQKELSAALRNGASSSTIDGIRHQIDLDYKNIRNMKDNISVLTNMVDDAYYDLYYFQNGIVVYRKADNGEEVYYNPDYENIWNGSMDRDTTGTKYRYWRGWGKSSEFQDNMDEAERQYREALHEAVEEAESRIK